MSTSVVIPVHNRPQLVRLAIESVQSQTLPVDEIIVVDDASSDETREVVSRLAQSDRRIRLIALTDNVGASAARNVGIEASSCDWVAFLDSDDAWDPKKHATQMKALAGAKGAIASFTGIRYVYPWGEKVEPLPAHFVRRRLRRMNFLSSTSTAIVSRQALLEAGGFDVQLPSCQDWDLWLRLSAAGEFVLIPEGLVTYTHVDAVRISSNRDKVRAGHAIVFERARAGEPWWRTRDLRAYHWVRLAQIEFWDFSNRWASLKMALASFVLRPSRAALAIGWEALRSSRRQ